MSVTCDEVQSESEEMKGASDDREYPPIEDYAVIGDCRTVALISRQGSIDWLCFPHFSAPAVFAALLDRRRGGRYAIRPATPFSVKRRYRGDTNVLETTFKTADGAVRLTDCMPIPAKSLSDRFLQPQREVLRVIEGIEGEMAMEIIYEPRPDYARARYRLRRCGALGWTCQYQDQVLILHSDLPLEANADNTAVRGQVSLSAGQKHYLSLGHTQRDVAVVAPLGEAAENRLRETLRWWQSWGDCCSFDMPFRQPVLRSALTLKLLTYALSGAVVAAPTTSLPEALGGVRNWDYRFCWLRDASLTLQAFMDLNYRTEAGAFLDWLLHATRLTWPELNVLYDVYGEVHLPEEVLEDFQGYQGSKPVRIGNDAKDQLQLDVYGAVVHAAVGYIRRGGRLSRDEARVLTGFGHTVCRYWREPDEGIWEIRDQRRHNTYSKLMCWATLNCLIELHRGGHVHIPEAQFLRERKAIEEAIESRGFNPDLNSYVGAFDGTDADASLLLMAHCGYVAPTDPRMVGTYHYICDQLGHNGLIYRYPPGTDALPPGEGAFGIASFWAVDYLARQGRCNEAREKFEHLLSFANDVGLFGEEIDPQTGAALGNFPQAFTHVGLIAAAVSLAHAEASSSQTDH